MLRYALVIGPLLISTSALSDDEKDTSYYCTEQHSAGVAFDVRTKEWNNTFFKADGAFVLHLHYLGDKAPTDLPKATAVQQYSLTVTPQGSNSGRRCLNFERDPLLGKDDPPVYRDWEKERMSCWTSGGLYRFNLVNNRFVYFYPYGFIEGRDDGRDTPSVSAGTCTLIQ